MFNKWFRQAHHKLIARLRGSLPHRVETSDRAALLWLRWLFFLVLFFIALYSYHEGGNLRELVLQLSLVVIYGLSTVALTWATRRAFSLARWTIPIFLMDLVLVGLVLYRTVGPDTDFYLMCFMIIYLSTLGRRVRDAISLAFIACLLYLVMMLHRNPEIELLDTRILLRLTFLLVLSLFTSYFSEETDRSRREVMEMEAIQSLLKRERDNAIRKAREQQAALIQAEKLSAMGHMAGALAHEIRNPLSVIIGYVEDLLASTPEDQTIRKPLEAVGRSAKRCYELMSNLLRFARRPRELEVIQLKETIEDTLTLARVNAKMSGVQIATDIQQDAQMTGRRSEIQQVLLNLITNGLDAMPKGGTLAVRLDKETSNGKEWIVLSVKDTGSGIPQEVLDHIFDPFFTTKGPDRGTGLGLSIVRDILNQYNGTIEIQTEPNIGTTMAVRLPAESPAVPPTGPVG